MFELLVIGGVGTMPKRWTPLKKACYSDILAYAHAKRATKLKDCHALIVFNVKFHIFMIPSIALLIFV